MSAQASYTNDPANQMVQAPKGKKAKATPVEPELCSICADTYTAVLRRKITCTFCNKSTCSKCIEQYLLSRPEDAHCVHCRVNYSDLVLKTTCTKTYLQHTYYRHRQEILVNRERANLPALQDAAQQERRRRRRQELYRHINKEIDELRENKRMTSVRLSQLYALAQQKAKAKEDTKEIQDQYLDLIQQERRLTREIRVKRQGAWARVRDEMGADSDNEDGDNKEDGKEDNKEDGANDNKEDSKDSKERKKFIRRCMKPNCQGFLSTAWKCGICEHYSCSKCFTVKGPDHDSPHECKKEDLETADLIRKDSKPCPNCGEFINKYTGCFARDTPILLWDGGVKSAQDIEVGDKLVGDDGQPRTVQALVDGVEDLYEVSQTNGMSYTVTGAHTLVLRNHRQQVHEMTVFHYLALPVTTQMILRGYKGNTAQSDSQISIQPVGPGEFYGWKVDGNRRFLLKDGTTTHNCSQVWCVSCQTPWDWETGRIITRGVIHNPHYYEWLKRTGGAMPRNPADVPCGGFPGAGELRPVERNAYPQCAYYFTEFHRLCMEIQDQSERQYRSHLDENGLRDTHVRFLLGDFDEKAWGQRLALAEKKRKRDAEIQEVFAAFRMVAVELINRIQHYRDETWDAFINLPPPKANAYLTEWNVEAQALLRMVNDGLRDISLSYGCTVPFIHIGTTMTYHRRYPTWQEANQELLGYLQRYPYRSPTVAREPIETVHYCLLSKKWTGERRSTKGTKGQTVQTVREDKDKKVRKDQDKEDKDKEDQEDQEEKDQEEKDQDQVAQLAQDLDQEDQDQDQDDLEEEEDPEDEEIQMALALERSLVEK